MVGEQFELLHSEDIFKKPWMMIQVYFSLYKTDLKNTVVFLK